MTETEQFGQSQSKILHNKKCREDAEEFVRLLGEQPERFWEVLYSLILAKLPNLAKDPLDPMSEEEAIKFEKTPISFGAHQGKEIGVIPTHYLIWLTENSFDILCKRYVKSKLFQERLREES